MAKKILIIGAGIAGLSKVSRTGFHRFQDTQRLNVTIVEQSHGGGVPAGVEIVRLTTVEGAFGPQGIAFGPRALEPVVLDHLGFELSVLGLAHGW